MRWRSTGLLPGFRENLSLPAGGRAGKPGRLREALDRDAERLAEDAGAGGEITSQPTHNADRDTEGLEIDVAAAESEADILDGVETALRRMDEGTYGRCEECGSEIADSRLEALPYASLCIDCASARERDRERG